MSKFKVGDKVYILRPEDWCDIEYFKKLFIFEILPQPNGAVGHVLISDSGYNPNRIFYTNELGLVDEPTIEEKSIPISELKAIFNTALIRNEQDMKYFTPNTSANLLLHHLGALIDKYEDVE